jgi:putative restriction endonuclease
MPAIKSTELLTSLIDAFQESETPATFLASKTVHPRCFIIQTPQGTFEVWVYAWTLTHGGRPNLPDEYRIQMTTVSSPLDLNPNGFTLLLGYEPNMKMFAGFDLDRHCKFTTGSPSVQIDIKCLHRALQDGMAFDRKDNNEIAVGIRPDQLFHYLINSSELHRYGKAQNTFRLLAKASTLSKISNVELSKLSEERKKVVSTVTRLSRSANFRQQVMTAYANRCAITRMQLRLVEAAHILPVGITGSVDDVSNGIALSPTFHRAFDNGLIFLDEDYKMQINLSKEAQLVTLNLDGGLIDFKNFLQKRIHLPSDKRQWPDIHFIKEGNRVRRIPKN